MNQHCLDLLEFAKVRQALAGLTVLEAARAAVAELVTPGTDAGEIATRRDQTSELVGLLVGGRSVEIVPLADPRPALERARIADSHLDPAELLQVGLLLRNAAKVRQFFKTHAEAAPLVNRLAGGLLVLGDLEEAIGRAIGDDGAVRDSASPELRHLRHSLSEMRRRIERKLESLLHNPDLADAFAGDRPTQRGGRLVLPVKATRWTVLGGLVHDRSQTGQTFFVEPPEVVELGNDLQNLAAEEEAEVRRILLALTERLRPHLDTLRFSFQVLILIDVLQASARLAHRDDLVPARIAAPGEATELVDARHPILQAALAADRRADQLVPLTLRLERNLRTIAITGSNTGGKTVALKTIGLLALMAQSGLHLPARRATLPIFDDVLVDVGDEQSIEQSLSTFSGHMKAIVAVLGRATARSLVLLDELGSGTDPAEGGALACSILQSLADRGATTIATTHLREVKIYCDEHTGMQNAAMEFDLATLRPTFRLIQGQPGQSHALTIARRLGLPDDVFERARSLMSDEHLNLEQLLARATEDRRRLTEELETASHERETAAAERQKLQADLAELKRGRKALLQEAYREASGIVDNTKHEMQQVLREAKEQAAGGQANVEPLREKVRQRKAAMAKGAAAAEERKRPRVPPEALREGQTVYLETFRATGIVQDVNQRKGRATVLVRGLAVEVKISDLSLPEESPAEQAAATPVQFSRNAQATPLEINLIGQRVAEAVEQLDRFLDQACLADYEQVAVIHGRGTGALMRGLREHLKGHRLVASFRSGNQAEGGVAVTVVKLKE
jgi:DNA mismatch repair protein MutS2